MTAHARSLAPVDEHEALLAWLVGLAARRLDIPAADLDADVPLARLGLDSLAALEILGELETRVGVTLPLASVIEADSLHALIDSALSCRDTAATAPVRTDADPPFDGLSPGERALWLQHAAQPERVSYNLARAVRLCSPVDASALSDAIEALFERHPALRTTYPVDASGQPRRRVATRAREAFQWVSNALETDTETLLARARDEAERPIDLAAGPLARVHAYPRSDGSCILLLVAHHIVVDHASLGVLLRDLGVLYDARLTGRRARLPRSTARFDRFARAQHGRSDGPAIDALVSFWQHALHDAPGSLAIPTDRARASARLHRGAAVRCEIGASSVADLRALARGSDTTLFVVLLAVFQTVLARASGQHDVVLGAPTLGRPTTGFDDVVGYFVNPVPLRVRSSGDPSFHALVARTRRVVRDALTHAELPFARLVEALRIPHDATRSPVFQASFVLQQAHRTGHPDAGALTVADASAEIDLGSLRLEPLDLVHAVTPVDLSLCAAEHGGRLSVALEYDADLFDESTALRLVDAFARVARSVARDPMQRISSLPVLAREAIAGLEAWEHGGVGAAHATLHGRFEACATRWPDATAVICGDDAISYADLDRAADSIAASLRARGVAPEAVVGVRADRSIAFVAAVLGVLKAGGAYLPMEPTLPAARVRAMLTDARARWLLTDATQLDAHAVPEGVEVMGLAGHPAAARRASTSRPGNLAYVIFTSGSTGRPRGVACTHANATHLLGAIDALAPLRSGARASAWTGVGFDVSVYEIFAPLTSGGTLDLLPDAVRDDETAFLDRLVHCAVESAYVPPFWLPSLARRLECAPGPIALTRLLVGVEPIAASLLARLRERVPGLAIVNGYGPTETTVCCTLHVVPRGAAGEDRAPIGRPAPGNTVRVLDAHGARVPVGTVGELYVGGAGVARGYHGSPAETAARFVPDPFAHEEGARMYRTGDRVRWRSDGQLEFVGRADRQLKLRGVRIEPGEIESVLRAHASVSDAAVVALPSDAPGAPGLVAYVAAQGSEHPASDLLRDFVRRRLPAVMVPSCIVVLAALPRTANGKVDRDALPAPRMSATRLRPPVGATEIALADLFRALLNVDAVGRDDEFFALGGHSLLATRLVNRIEDTLGVQLPLRALFELPSLIDLARQVDAARPAGRSDPVACVSRDAPLVLSFVQESLFFLDRLAPGRATYNLAHALRLTGPLDVSALQRSLAAVVDRHESLRTVFACVDGVPMQRIIAPGGLHLPVDDLTGQTGATALQRACDDAETPFDLEIGPLFRTRLLRLDEREHVLLIAMHHAVADGWSVAVLRRELATCYRAFVAGHRPALPTLAIQYADFAAWQRLRMDDPAMIPLQQYWVDTLSGAAVLELPTDRPRPPVASQRGADVRCVVPRAMVSGLDALARREQTTRFTVLLSALATVLGQHAGQHDVVVGSTIAHRPRRELEGLIGAFANTQALRVDLEGNPAFTALLARTRRVTLGAQSHQDIPFERVVEALQPPRSRARNPFFDVMISVQEADDADLALPGLVDSPMEVETRSARFDLTFLITPCDGALDVRVEYATDLFDAQTVAWIAQHLTTRIADLVARPDARLDTLALLSDDERAMLLTHWGRGPVRTAPAVCLHELVSAQARRTPDAVALRHEGTALRYRELEARADALAWQLIERGVGPESRVAVCLARTPSLVIALLAVLKAGGAYVPLDPAYPRDRIAFMLADAGAMLVVTERDRTPCLPPDSAATWLVIDTLHEETRSDAPPDRARPANLAYVIYTSGSTGQPKGVAITHASASARIAWARDTFSSDDLAGVLAATSVCFDLSVFELFVPLATGGAAVLARDPLALIEGLADAPHVTLVNTVPSAMAELVTARAIPPGVRVVNLAGEVLSTELVRAVQASGVARVHDLYGPSEDTTYSTAVLRDGSSAASIGTPIDGTRAYILDAHDRLAPAGAAGELCLAGDGLARGYLARAARTAERFVPDPFATSPGARMYRTGDRARWNRDGRIEYLGRLDRQVKLRGFRVELGEIEHALASLPTVHGAAVVVRDEPTGLRRLVGYVVVGHGTDLGTLRDALRSRLPAYMVPATLVALDALPRTPNGKIDRKALPAPDDALTGYEPPRTEVETTLAAIWCDVLRVARVGIHDNFFERGGDSMLALRVVSRATAAGIQLRARDLLEHQTIAALASTVCAGASPPVRTAHTGQAAAPGPVPLTPAQAFHLERIAPALVDQWNVTGMLRFAASLPVPAVVAAVEAATEREECLRLRFGHGDDGWTQCLSADAIAPRVDVVDLTHLPEEDRVAELERRAGEAQASLDVAHGPVARFVIFELGPRLERRLLLVAHWLVMDAVSFRTLSETVHTALQQIRRDEPIALTPRGTSFVEWARASASQAARATDDLPYWLEIARRFVPRLPDESTGGPNTYGTRATAATGLTVEQTRAFSRTARRHAVPASVVLAAAYAWAVHRWSGQSQTVMVVSSHGREGSTPGVDVSSAVGRIAGFFPLLLDVTGCDDARQALTAATAAYDSIPHGGSTFALLDRVALDPQDRAALERLAGAETRLDYTGQVFENLEALDDFTIATESTGTTFSPTRPRRLTFFLPASIHQSRLRLEVHYSYNQHRAETVQSIVETMRDALLAMSADDPHPAASPRP